MAAQPHLDIKSLPPNGHVHGVYSLVNPQIGTTRAGKSFLKCILRDATGELVSRKWTFEEGELNEVSATGFVWVAGHTQVYNGQTQLIVEEIRAVEVSQEQLAALLPMTTFDIDAMFAEVRGILGTLLHPAMRALAEAYFADEQLMTGFKRAPAAVSMHHAWIGGLLEHTLQLLKLADLMLPLYPGLNRDIVLMGLFLHDLGKTGEMIWEQGFDYTEDGNLIGHVVRGAIWLQFKAAVASRQSGIKLPPSALRVLQHIILSHHGVPEFGAAKVPSTPEAIFISQLDNLDAKTAMGLGHAGRPEAGADAAQPAGFTDKLWALDTRLYKPDPLREQSAASSVPAAVPAE
jgi:3'-5' exoribonuclease